MRSRHDLKEQSAHSDPWPWGWPGALVLLSALIVVYLLGSLIVSEYHLARQERALPCLRAGGHLGAWGGCWIKQNDGTKVRIELP